MLFLAVLMAISSFFSFLLHRANAAGTIDLNIRQLILRKTPAECCRSEVECMLLGLPRQPNRTSYDHCRLTFQLCISVPEARSTECLILARKFSLDVHMNKPLNWEDRTFSAVELPSRSFNFTSAAIDSPNVSIIVEVWNTANDKLLLYSRNFVHISPSDTTPKTLSTTSSQNSLIYQLSASCHAGFIGEGCALVCDPPGPADHYECSPKTGLVCQEGWTGPRCSQAICTLPCLNAATCAGPDECRCGKGWRGKQCEECIPKQGCSNGYCVSEPGKCICKPNWTGADCNLRINKCLEKPCRNGGRCTTNGLHGEAFHCTCRNGFTGEDCSKLVSPCSSSPCGLHGDCIPTGSLPTDIYCRCHPGYWGSDCSNDRRRVVKPVPPVPSTLTPTPNNNKTGDAILRPKIFIQSSTPEEKELKQIWVVNTLVAVCALLLLLILIALCAPMFANKKCAFNCLHLKPGQEEQKKKRTPRFYSLSQDVNTYEDELRRDEEELASVKSSLIVSKDRPIIMEEVGEERLQGDGAGKSGRVTLDAQNSSAFCPRNRWRSAISLTHISEQDEEEVALELELRQNLTNEIVRSSPRSTNSQQARRLTPLSTLLLLKSPPPPYSERSNQQEEHNCSIEDVIATTDHQSRTSRNLKSIAELETKVGEKAISTIIQPENCGPTIFKAKDSRPTVVQPQDSRLTATQPEDSRPAVVQSRRIIDLNQRPGATHSSESPTPPFGTRHTKPRKLSSAHYDSLV